MEDLEAKAKAATESGEYNKVMYITDGVFSMDGDVAKIPEIVEICENTMSLLMLMTLMEQVSWVKVTVL